MSTNDPLFSVRPVVDKAQFDHGEDARVFTVLDVVLVRCEFNANVDLALQ